MAKLDDIISLVQKILEVAARSDKPGEVAAAQAKAQELIVRYQIEEAQLNGRTKPGDITGVRLDVEDPYQSEKSILLNTIARHNYCRVLRGAGYCMVYGYNDDIQFTIRLYQILSLHMVAEMRRKAKIARSNSVGKFYTKAWVSSFFNGYCVTIDERLKEAIKSAINSMDNPNSVAIVVRDKAHAIEEYFQKLSRTPPTKRKVSKAALGYADGSDSARLADLNQTRIEE